MDAWIQFLLGYPTLIYGGVGALACITVGALIYKIVPRKRPTHANVNCWFCNENTIVPYGNRNCWDCPNCEQYNGFQENGDYNKPIPAQFREDLNHGVSGSLPSSVTPPMQQYVNGQMLLCKKCNNNQSVKIKQLASFIPRDDDNYDEEIEAYKHHLEQTYKLCRPCQAAVEYYIKYQNRQLRTALLGYRLRRSQDSDKGYIKSSSSMSVPMQVILLRALAFLISALLVAASFCNVPVGLTAPSGPQTLSGGIIPPKPSNESISNNKSSESVPVWQGLMELLPDKAIENAKVVWQHGRDNQLAVVSVGLSTCLVGIFLAGPARLRRIDKVASVLWLLLLFLHLAENYFAGALGWMDTTKLSTVCLCCLVSFAAAVATRKPGRARSRRYLAGSSAVHPFISQPHLAAESFVPIPPPNLSKLINRKRSPRKPKMTPSTLLGDLRALSLGNWSSFTRTNYFLLTSGSRPSSPGPSPAPSEAGSVTSSSGSTWQRRPLISPSRLNIKGQKLRLFSAEPEPSPTPPPVSPSSSFGVPTTSLYNGSFSRNIWSSHGQNDFSSWGQSSSSESSSCKVGTTTQELESTPPPKDSGCLFSGSRPASQYKDSPPSDYFSLTSRSWPSPGHSPTPSVAGSIVSSSGSTRQRRPLISPSRLNISGQKLRLFSSEPEPSRTFPSSSFGVPTTSLYSGSSSRYMWPSQSQNDFSSLLRDHTEIKGEDGRSSSSESSSCKVGTTTQELDNNPPPKGFFKHLTWPRLVLVSMITSLVACHYIYSNWDELLTGLMLIFPLT